MKSKSIKCLLAIFTLCVGLAEAGTERHYKHLKPRALFNYDVCNVGHQQLNNVTVQFKTLYEGETANIYHPFDDTTTNFGPIMPGNSPCAGPVSVERGGDFYMSYKDQYGEIHEVGDRENFNTWTISFEENKLY